MNRELLADLTAAPGGADAIVTAARRHAARKRQARALGLAGAAVLALAGAFLTLPSRHRVPPVAQAPAPSVMLTQNELLDSFGDEPVALITWPDGRQQLLAIARPRSNR